jgi:nucleoside-diphosphate-sugar epimerase
MRALVGCTGFIGSNLANQSSFDCVYNSSNIDDICGKNFKEVFFAGLSGVKWKANANSEEDKNSVDKMISRLLTINVENFIHISTIDVYENHLGVDEDTPISCNQCPYGLNRSNFENFVLSKFENCISIRLPIVFGNGFKKNYLFDMLNEKNLDRIFLQNRVQFYDVSDLTRDIMHHKKYSRRIVNFATEPVVLEEIVDLYFPNLKDRCVNDSNYSSDMKSKYAFGGYFQNKEVILQKIGEFVK